MITFEVGYLPKPGGAYNSLQIEADTVEAAISELERRVEPFALVDARQFSGRGQSRTDRYGWVTIWQAVDRQFDRPDYSEDSYWSAD